VSQYFNVPNINELFTQREKRLREKTQRELPHREERQGKTFFLQKNKKMTLHCRKSSERFGPKCEFSLVPNKYIPYIGLV
jgi:hypothetical protein